MPGPTLSPAEIANLTAAAAKATSAAATFQAQIAAQQAEAAKLAVTDGAFKKFFDYYDTNIIKQYDLERRAINGRYVDTPIVEADIVSAGSLAGGRIQPALPATDVIRIGQFDGTPLLQDASGYELFAIPEQAVAEARLVTGYGGTAPAVTILTDTALTSGSTTLTLKDTTTTFSLAPNSVYVVLSGGDLCVFKVLTFVMQVSPVPPPYIANLTIQMIVPPSGTIAIGQQLTVFNGFTNAERTAKTTTNPLYQPLMNYLIAELQSKITARIATLNPQLAPIAANQDPDAVAELATAASNVNASKTFLTNYLITTIISNTGITSLSTERGTRTTQANTRISQITTGYTGRTKNYYNERYNAANNRANTSRGSLRLQKNAEQGATTSANFAATLGDQASAINSILP